MYYLKASLDILVKLKEFGDSNPTEEVVAVLLGKNLNEKKSVLLDFKKVDNIYENKRDLYIPDYNQFFQILKTTTFLDKSSKIDFVGIFHTHPYDLPYPSIIDIKNAGYIGFYIIYSPLFKCMKAFYNKKEYTNFKKARIII